MEPVLLSRSADVNLSLIKAMMVKFGEPSDNFQNQLDTINQEIQDLETEKDMLFGIEASRKEQIEYQLSSLNRKKKDIEPKVKFHQFGYSNWISPEPLFWRNKETKLPFFAMFSLTSPISYFEMVWRDNGTTPYRFDIHPALPGSLSTNPYKDVESLLKTESYKPNPKKIRPNSDAIVRLGTSFSGTIPAQTRQKIIDAEKAKIFQKIYLLAEVEEWKVKTLVPVSVDPLIIGWTESYPDRLWYIDAFDITPLENQIPIR